MVNKTENDIMCLWKKEYNNVPMVSIKCLTYNQEDYIENALDSFLLQKTSFPFEIVVHDDASTDGTSNIIMKYAKRYPNIIKAIIEEKNQYSKKDGSINRIVNSKISGKYIAYCEGDDYWTDSMKLQKQFEIMEMNPEINICAHTVKKIDATSGKKLGYIRPSNQDCVFGTEEVIKGGGGFVGTNSLFFRREIMHNEPLFRKMMEIDYTLQVAGALKGGMLYIDSCMSNYRVLAKNSWSIGLDREYIRNFREQWIKVINQIDADTGFKYSKSIAEYLVKDKIDTALLLGDCEMLNNMECKSFYKKMCGIKKYEYYLKANYPKIFLKIKSFMRK